LKVLLVGPYPPPYGGIAVTVFDLRRYLMGRDDCEVLVLNIGERRAVPSAEYLTTRGPVDYVKQVFRFARRGYTIHLETNGHNLKSWLSASVCAVAGMWNDRRTIAAFGSGNLPAYLRQLKGWPRLVVRIVLKWSGMIICRNEDMVEALRAFGVGEGRIRVLPGFVGLDSRRMGQVPRIVEEFCRAHDPVLGAAGDLSPEYGMPLALRALAGLREQYPKIGLVLLGVGSEDEAHLADLQPVRDQALLAGRVSPEDALAVISRLSVFIRPTYFDGDSISVREAVALGVPVVASDTGLRPTGVKRFRIGDMEDLCRQVAAVLGGGGDKQGLERIPEREKGSAAALLELYSLLQVPRGVQGCGPLSARREAGIKPE
jgi:glycosyltransferase involved in cell wall biosynthesis